MKESSRTSFIFHRFGRNIIQSIYVCVYIWLKAFIINNFHYISEIASSSLKNMSILGRSICKATFQKPSPAIKLANYSTTSHLLSHFSGNLVKQHAVASLIQTRSLLRELTDADYVKKIPRFYDQSIGSHIRHSLSHFDRVCDNVQNGDILHYDVRERNTAVENHKEAADARIQHLITVINDMHVSYATQISVEFMSPVHAESSEPTSYIIKSNLMRELSFVAHHNTHHLALVRLMMDHLGYQVEDRTIGKLSISLLYIYL